MLAATLVEVAEELLVVVGRNRTAYDARGLRGTRDPASFEQPEAGVDHGREDDDHQKELSHDSKVRRVGKCRCQIAAYPEPVKAFLVYTLARLGVFVASYALVLGAYLLITGERAVPILWPLLVAILISSAASIYLLRGLRENFARVIDERARKAAAAFEAARSKEDLPE